MVSPVLVVGVGDHAPPCVLAEVEAFGLPSLPCMGLHGACVCMHEVPVSGIHGSGGSNAAYGRIRNGCSPRLGRRRDCNEALHRNGKEAGRLRQKQCCPESEEGL